MGRLPVSAPRTDTGEVAPIEEAHLDELLAFVADWRTGVPGQRVAMLRSIDSVFVQLERLATEVKRTREFGRCAECGNPGPQDLRGH